MSTAINPILEGFYPDPSICAVGDDYYLVNSSFAYFPGIPVFHSKDLAHWEQIGNALDRSSQLPLGNCGHSSGIYAPTIRFNNEKYYIITTNVFHKGNFIITADKPEGPWSEPYYLGKAAAGIDPSLFFDDDGCCYYVGTRPNSEGVKYNGDWEIWVQRVDLETMQLTDESHKVWQGALKNAIWPEGPHLYKKDGYYYIMNAEGGTSKQHSITVARSLKIFGEYENNPSNPILTHRHMGKDFSPHSIGHGDLVETADGSWYIVMLGSRSCCGYTNLGRETFIAKVTWEYGWPVVNEGVGMLTEVVHTSLPEYTVMPESPCHHFFGDRLSFDMVMLREPSKNMFSLKEREGYLRLFLQPYELKELGSPSYIGIRQKHYDYMVSAMLDFSPIDENEAAGLAVLQSNEYNLRFELLGTDKNNNKVHVIQCQKASDILIAEVNIPKGRIVLKIITRGQNGSFYCQIGNNDILIAENIDMSYLSTETAGGFVGCTIGMYASSNGESSSNHADFGWLEYQAL